MNKKEAIAYGQIALDTILHSTYKEQINLKVFSLEMKQAFKMYPKNIVMQIADAKIYAENELSNCKRCDYDE